MENRNQKPAGENRPARRPAGGKPPRGQAGQPPRRPAAGQPRVPAGRPPQDGPARDPRQERKRRRSESRWFRAILMVLCTLGVCVFLAVFILRSALDLFGLNQEDRQIEVSIPENPSLSQIASILRKADVIDQQLTFRLYASLQNDEQYYGGTYIFNANMAYTEILRDLRTQSSQKEIVELTFTEGRNAYEIAQYLEDYEVCNADEFLEHLQTADFGYEFMDQLPESALRFRRLEGYIFPDTYEFYVGENVNSVARKFLSNFNDKITAQMRARMLNLNLTLDETLTLASIIEKEAGGGTEEDMQKVSAVFHNRMNLREVYPKLQSDVTKHYVNSFIIPFQDIRNQDMYDAYNTYVCDGLPVGPICNPGMSAIQAALYPATTGDFFFVTDVEEHFYYAETAEQHYANIVAASKVEGEGKIHGTDTE